MDGKYLIKAIERSEHRSTVVMESDDGLLITVVGKNDVMDIVDHSQVYEVGFEMVAGEPREVKSAEPAADGKNDSKKQGKDGEPGAK